LVIVTGLAWKRSPPPQLATAPVVVADIESTVLAAGTLEPTQMVNVGAQVSGQIKTLRVELGDTVKAGDLIAEIDSTTQENEVRKASAAVQSLRAQRAVQVALLRQAEPGRARIRAAEDDAELRGDLARRL
jgi:macrolide-specific efflux system membrane fusion protein